MSFSTWELTALEHTSWGDWEEKHFSQWLTLALYSLHLPRLATTILLSDYEFDYSRYFVYMESSSFCPSMIALFLLGQCLQVYSMLCICQNSLSLGAMVYLIFMV